MPYIGQGLTEGRRRAYNFVATGSQTTFSATYDVGYIDVYQNGILLTPSDYTATNGTTVVLGVGASASDEITIIAHQIFSINDTVSASQGGSFGGAIDISGNITTTGSLQGPSSFTIDPATHGDNTGTVVIAGDLTVNGTTTTINSTTLTVDDKNIIIASGSSNSSTADGSGLTVDLGSDGTATMTYTHATTSFNFNKQIRGTGANFTEAVTFNGNNYNIAFYNSSNAIKFFDNAKAQFGTGGDLSISHNGNHSHIKDEGTGQLRICGSVVHIRNSANDETMLFATENGAVELYHDNVKKLETTSSGVTVTGTTYSSLNLGIRISSPAYNLHVHQDDSDASYALFTNTTTGTTANDGFRIGIDSNESALIWHREAEDIIFATSNTERMRIDSSGNVSIGNLAPAHPLHIYEGGGYYASIGRGNSTPGGTDPWLGLYDNVDIASSTFGWGIYDSSADGSLQIWNKNNNATGTNTFTIKRGGNVGIGTNSPNRQLVLYRNDSDQTQIQFQNQTTGAGSSDGFGVGLDTQEDGFLWNYEGGDIYFGRASDRFMTLKGSSGNVGIGTSDPTTYAGSKGGMVIYRAGGSSNAMLSCANTTGSGTMRQIDFFQGTSTSRVGAIESTTTATTYLTTSDRRLKENIKPIQDATEKILAMNPVSHTWINDKTTPAQHGFIAQEMQSIIPEAVSGDADSEEMMQMDYGKITPVIVKSLQDALQEISSLKQQISKLEEKINVTK